jgi:hypothetical protein
MVYVGSEDGKIYALYPSGVEKWSYQTNGAVRSSPVVADNGTLYVGSDDHYLYALGPDGTLQWRYLTGDYLHCFAVYFVPDKGQGQARKVASATGTADNDIGPDIPDTWHLHYNPDLHQARWHKGSEGSELH